jgi:hypothetical protein
VAIRGALDGAAEPAGEGRARAKLKDAVIEGPAEMLGGSTIDVDLSRD